MGGASQKEELAHLRKRVAELENLNLRQRLTDEELDREGGFSETVLNSMKEAVYVADAKEFKIVYCNTAFLEKYGFEGDQVIGRTCYKVTRRRDKPCVLTDKDCPSFQTLSTGRPITSEQTFVDAKGRQVHVECFTLPVLDKKGRVSRILHIDSDITKRKQTEDKLHQANQELRRSNAFLRNLIMSSVDAVIAADMTGKILIFNKAAGKITGYTESEARNELNIRDIYPDDGAREVMRRLRSEQHGGKGKLKSEEVELLCKDGSLVPISLSAAIVYQEGAEVGTVGFFYDLRERRRMESELDKTRIQLLQAEKMASIGKLAAGVAHQLNNPLGGITLFSQLLLEEYDLGPEARKDVQRILDDAERCRDIVSELLQFSRQTSQEARPSDINEALSRTLFLLENQALFQNIKIKTSFDDSIARVVADVQQLNQAFMNIILNAADSMKGRGQIEVSTSPGPGGKGVVIQISDTGPGIPEEALPHIFEPFFTTKEEGQGTGLGLSVAFGIIENHNGKISAANRPQGGVTFVIELPPNPLSDRGDADGR